MNAREQDRKKTTIDTVSHRSVTPLAELTILYLRLHSAAFARGRGLARGLAWPGQRPAVACAVGNHADVLSTN